MFYVCVLYLASLMLTATVLVRRVSAKLVYGLQQVKREKEKVCIDVTLEAIDLKWQPHKFIG